MGNTAQNFETLFLTYRDVKQANPGWTDPMIEDYLALKRDLLLVSESGDVSQAQLDAVIARVVVLEAQMVDVLLRLGVTETQIADILIRLGVVEGQITSILLRLDALEALVPVDVTTAINYTATASANVTCTNTTEITITLPLVPVEGMIVRVKQAGAAVVIDANGSAIDGSATIKLDRQYTGLQFVYSPNSSWNIT